MTYFTTHSDLEPTLNGGKMTIGIGVICERGDCVVVASDMRATYGTTPIGPHDQCGKIFRLSPFPTMACVAGNLSECHAIISQVAHNIRSLQRIKGRLGREHFMNVIDEARAREMRLIYSWTLRTKMGISLTEWVQGKVVGGMDKLVLRAGLSFMKDAPLRVELIVAGFARGQTMFFRAVQKRRLEEESSPAVYVIGKGQVHAMDVLNRRSQNHFMSLPRTLLHLHEAMLAAREEKTVGPANGFIVMRKHVPEIAFLPADAPCIREFSVAYKTRTNTGSLDDSRVAAMNVYQQLKILKITKGNR